MDLETIPEEKSNNVVKYTIIVKDDKNKYSSVYTGSCCQSRLKQFTENRTCLFNTPSTNTSHVGTTGHTKESRDGCCNIS